jgi:hypothetical protein
MPRWTLSATRPVARTIGPIGSPSTNALPEAPPPTEITYKGYRIEPASYAVNSTAWSPRVVVSLRNDEGTWQRTPVYSTNTAKFPTRDEADRRSLDVARTWIDAATERQRLTGLGPVRLGNGPASGRD